MLRIDNLQLHGGSTVHSSVRNLHFYAVYYTGTDYCSLTAVQLHVTAVHSCSLSTSEADSVVRYGYPNRRRGADSCVIRDSDGVNRYTVCRYTYTTPIPVYVRFPNPMGASRDMSRSVSTTAVGRLI